MKHDLDVVDRETRWYYRNYVPLEAEVDVVEGHRRSRRVMDLFSAVQQQAGSRLFVILGDPGSGKSVALRGLARALLSEVGSTGRVPVYVNLKGWRTEQRWSSENPPTEDDLRQFVFTDLRTRVANVSKALVEQYGERLLERGRWFFIFDSFDEIPGVLDSDEGSWLIARLSDIVVRFLLSGQGSRGIVASRYYRRPDISLEERCVLDVRPFSDAKIAAAIDQIASDPRALKVALFHKRPDLGAIARNPFLLSLILQYARSRAAIVPTNRAELVDSYIQECLDLAEHDLRRADLTRSDVFLIARRIAWEMFSSDIYGLEIPVSALRHTFRDERVQDVIDFLVAARLGRLSSGARLFSFVHRRFNEYFLVEGFREHPDRVPFDAIPHDSRWRDALVLYAEVADVQDAFTLARFCWTHVHTLFHRAQDWSQYRRSLHSLRFMTESFRGRREIVAEFEPELSVLMCDLLLREDNLDLLAAKHAVEAAGLLSDASAEEVLLLALDQENKWISETAFRACRYLSTASESIRNRIESYVLGSGALTIIRRYQELMLSLESADLFKNIAAKTSRRRAEVLAHCASLIGIAILFPLVLAFMVTLPAVIAFQHYLMSAGIVALSAVWRRSTLSPPADTVYRFLFGRDVVDALRRAAAVTTLAVVAYLLIDAVRSTVETWELPDLDFVRLVLAGISATWLPAYVIGRESDGVDLWIACGTLAVLLVALLPWTSSRRALAFLSPASMFAVVVQIPVAIAIMLGISVVMPWIVDWIAWPALVGFGGLLVASSVGVTIATARQVRRYAADRQVYRSVTRAFNPSRYAIAEAFNGFQTRMYRTRYVEWLSRISLDHLGSLGRQDNRWPDNQRPNAENDRASTMLAQLDARWMRIDA